MRKPFVFVIVSISTLQAEQPPKLYSRVPAVREGTPVLWHNPGRVGALDLAYGIAGRAMAPRPPYRFLREDLGGSNSEVRVRDANSREWSVKFGEGASPDTFASRLAWPRVTTWSQRIM